MLPLHWVPPVLDITPVSVRREERAFKSPFCCLNIFPVKHQGKHVHSVCLESSLQATSHQHLLRPHVEVMVEVLDNGTLHLCSTSHFQSAVKTQGSLSVPGGRGSSALFTLVYGQKSWDAERLSGLPKPTQQVSVRSQIRLGVFLALAVIVQSAGVRCPHEMLLVKHGNFVQSLSKCAERPCLGDNADCFCLYFNMDLEDILQILPRRKKIAFSGEKFRLKYCSVNGGISSCWAGCEELCNLAWGALICVVK